MSDHPTSGNWESASDERVPIPGQQLADALSIVWQVPRPWILLMSVVGALTSATINRSADGHVALEVHVGALALIALALIWLPALLRMLVLTGGSVKAGGVEASADGILTREVLMELLTRAKAVTTLRDKVGDGDALVAELDAAVDRVAYDVLDSDRSLDDGVLQQLGLEYERLRRDTPPGPLRTSAMTRIINETRVRAASSVQAATQKARRLVTSESQGERIIGLALLQEAPSAEVFHDILRIVRTSATAFEMFHALVALQELAPLLDDSQRQHAHNELILEQSDPRGVGITNDPALPTLIQMTLMQLRARVVKK